MIAFWRRRPLRTTLVMVVGLCWVVLVLTWMYYALGIPRLIPVNEDSLSGTYVVQYRIRGRPAGRDTLILLPDHTFVQICQPEKGQRVKIFRLGQHHTQTRENVEMSGTWEAASALSGHAVQLNGPLGPPVDPAFDDLGAREPYISWDLPIERHLTGLALVVDDDNDIRFWKKK